MVKLCRLSRLRTADLPIHEDNTDKKQCNIDSIMYFVVGIAFDPPSQITLFYHTTWSNDLWQCLSLTYVRMYPHNTTLQTITIVFILHLDPTPPHPPQSTLPPYLSQYTQTTLLSPYWLLPHSPTTWLLPHGPMT